MNYKGLTDRCSKITINASEEEVVNVEKRTRRQSDNSGLTIGQGA